MVPEARKVCFSNLRECFRPGDMLACWVWSEECSGNPGCYCKVLQAVLFSPRVIPLARSEDISRTVLSHGHHDSRSVMPGRPPLTTLGSLGKHTAEKFLGFLYNWVTQPLYTDYQNRVPSSSGQARSVLAQLKSCYYKSTLLCLVRWPRLIRLVWSRGNKLLPDLSLGLILPYLLPKI